MEYFGHIWVWCCTIILVVPRQCSKALMRSSGELFSILHTIIHRRILDRLFMLYLCGRCSDELHFSDLLGQTFTAWTRHYVLKIANHPHSLYLPLIKSKYHSGSFFHRTVTLWNKIPKKFFPEKYNLCFFKYRVKSHLSSLSP